MPIYAEVAGEGPNLVLVHEGICDSRMWDEQWERYTREFRVLRCDLRGFGRSALEPGTFSNAQDLLDVFEQHGFERAMLLGVSLGQARRRRGASQARASPPRAGRKREQTFTTPFAIL